MGRILAVDDELDRLTLIKMIIEGYSKPQVTITNNPLEVAELLTKNQYDLIIIDVKMPGLDGMDLLSLAKEHDKDVWIQRVTTFGSLASAKEALRRGAFDYLSKPFRKEQLHLALDQAWRWQEMTLQIKELKGQQEKD